MLVSSNIYTKVVNFYCIGLHFTSLFCSVLSVWCSRNVIKGSKEYARLLDDDERISQFLRQHIVLGQLRTSDLHLESVYTLQGNTATVYLFSVGYFFLKLFCLSSGCLFVFIFCLFVCVFCKWLHHSQDIPRSAHPHIQTLQNEYHSLLHQSLW